MFAFWVNYSFNVLQFCDVICQDTKTIVPSGLDTISNAWQLQKLNKHQTSRGNHIRPVW